MGPFLGLGSEREWGLNDCDMVCDYVACSGSRMVATRGFAVMAVFGNVVTAWSWFGVNQLSIGLHSYGFTDSASFWLLIFCLSQGLICLLGLLPLRFWKSGFPSAK